MAIHALYRIWRPTRFSDIVGQAPIVTTLKNQIASGRVGHAYLFSGSRGTGKTTTAKLFARAVNCTQTADGEPCEACEACNALLAENNMDVIEIDAASNNGVDEIRDLRERIKYPPQHGRFRVYIIDEVHMLSTGAFNALLKTLEEPPSHALFILATTEPQKLPATVLSRCQRFDFRRIPAQIIQQRMQTILDGEGSEVTPGALSLIARSAEGGMRDALSLLDMCIAYGGGSVDEALVRDVLGASDRGFLFQFVGHIISGNMAGALIDIDSLMRSGREAQVFARDVVAHLRGLLMAEACGEAALPDLLEITGEDAARLCAQAGEISRERLLLLLDLFIAADADMRFASQPRVALEIAAARACLPEETLRLEALSARLELLEKRIREGTVAMPAKERPPAAAREATEQPEAAHPLAEQEAAPPAPLDEALWEAAMTLLKKEPSLYGQIRQGRFAGIAEGAIEVAFAKEKSIHRDLLLRDGRKERVEAIFAQAAGGPVTLTFTLEGEKKEDTKGKQDKLQSVFDMFDREHVQVVDDPV